MKNTKSVKKKWKKIGERILIFLAVLFWGFPLVTCMAGKAFSMPVHQSVENISIIELLDTSRQSTVVLKTLDDGEIPEFMEKLLAMKAGKYVNDPPTQCGILTVKIYYLDGAVDLIGSDMCMYQLSTGEEKSKGWYYVGREEMYDLFSEYVHFRLLPDPDTIIG